MLTRGAKECYLRPYRMMITGGVIEWYLASLQDDDHSWSKRMVQVPFIYSASNHHSLRTPGTILYSTSDHHPLRTPGTILLLHEWSSSCKDARYHSFTPRVIIMVPDVFTGWWSLVELKNGTWRPYRMMITRGVKEWYLVLVPGVLSEWWSLVE
jgi:hypothetical protein